MTTDREPSETIQVRVSKRTLAIGLLLGCIAIGGGAGWYFITGTPEYSLYQLKNAIREKNELKIEHYLDQQGLVNDAVDRVWDKFEANLAQTVTENSSSGSGWEALGASIGIAMIQNMKPALKSTLSSTVNESVRDLIYSHTTAEGKGSTMPEFKLVKVERLSEKATVDLRMLNRTDAPLLRFNMSRNSDRSWRITSLSQQTIDEIWPNDQLTAAANPTQFAESSKSYQVTESGLKIQDLRVGNGNLPKPGDIVSVHYTAWFENGSKFDSSYDRGERFEFVLGQGQVIKGWDEGLLTMRTGGKRRLVIPPELGYGPRGAGDVIPPNATLIFEVDLLSIK